MSEQVTAHVAAVSENVELVRPVTCESFCRPDEASDEAESRCDGRRDPRGRRTG